MKYNINQLQNIFPHCNFEWTSQLGDVLNHLDDFEWYFVGGCVRDSLLNEFCSYDVDITTTATAAEVEQKMKNFTISTIGREFGTIGVYYKKWQIEITTTRRDIETFGRHATVNFVNNFYEDSERRDFTINALLFNHNELIDYHNGIQDLVNRHVIFIGSYTGQNTIQKKNVLKNIDIDINLLLQNACQRIQEDYLRILRYIRFYCRFNNDLNNFLYTKVIIQNLNGLNKISKERFISEIKSICNHSNRLFALNIICNLKIDTYMFLTSFNINYISLLYEHNLININYIFATLFLNTNINILKNIPLSRETLKIINWIHKSKYECDILQIAHIYNSSKNIEYVYLFALIRNIKLYNNIVNKSFNFIKIDLMQYDEKIRSIINDLCIGVQLL